MQSIQEIKDSFNNGEISKSGFINEMNKKHKVIFEYARIIEDTDIKSIHIEDNKIIMETRSENIKILCNENDKRTAPIEIINFSFYEYEEISMLKKLINKDSIVLDIGANIGYYSMVLSKYITNGKIYAFEPINKTFNYLIENIKLNKISNIVASNSALSNISGKTDFFYYEEGSVNASMKKLNDKVTNEVIKCDVIRMDEFIEKQKIKVDLIKCDTEGSEYLVFQGGKETIRMNKPIIFTEMLRKWSNKFNYNPNEVIKFFDDLGYNCFTIRNGFLKVFKYMTDETIETNFIFLHREKHLNYIKMFCI